MSGSSPATSDITCIEPGCNGTVEATVPLWLSLSADGQMVRAWSG